MPFLPAGTLVAAIVLEHANVDAQRRRAARSIARADSRGRHALVDEEGQIARHRREARQLGDRAPRAAAAAPADRARTRAGALRRRARGPRRDAARRRRRRARRRRSTRAAMFGMQARHARRPARSAALWPSAAHSSSTTPLTSKKSSGAPGLSQPSPWPCSRPAANQRSSGSSLRRAARRRRRPRRCARRRCRARGCAAAPGRARARASVRITDCSSRSGLAMRTCGSSRVDGERAAVVRADEAVGHDLVEPEPAQGVARGVVARRRRDRASAPAARSSRGSVGVTLVVTVQARDLLDEIDLARQIGPEGRHRDADVTGAFVDGVEPDGGEQLRPGDRARPCAPRMRLGARRAQLERLRRRSAADRRR